MFQNCFVIHNATNNQQLVSIPCGGGHRAWDLSLTTDNLYVTYIKKRAVALYQVPLFSYQTVYEVDIMIRASFLSLIKCYLLMETSDLSVYPAYYSDSHHTW